MSKISKLLLSFLLVVSLTACKGQNVDVKANQAKFDQYVESEFIDTITNDFMTLNLIYEDPKASGIDIGEVEVNLGLRPGESNYGDLKESFDKLKEINYDALNDASKDLYDAIYFSLEHNVALSEEEYAYYDQILTSMGGVHYAIPTYLSDYVIKNEEDVKELILLLSDVKPYLESSIEYIKIQYEKGLLILDKDEVLSTIQRLLDSGVNGSVIKETAAKLDKLALREQYLDEIIDLYQDEVLKAYQSLYDTIDGFKNSKLISGYAKMPNGKEYFKHILSLSIGSDKSVDQVKQLCLNGIQSSSNELVSLISKGNITEEDLSLSFKTEYESYKSIMEDIAERMREDFPDVGKIDYQIKALSEDVASTSGTAAYFNIPSIDSSTPRQLRVNPLIGDIKDYTTYNTVAHEGFPGHMYQFAYAINHFHPLLTYIVSSLPYTEGYAVYASYEANRYLDEVKKDALDLVKINEILTYYVVILADIGIHYDGWDQERFNEFMSDYFGNTGLEDLYDQLSANPAAFENYYIGYHEIRTLKDKAIQELGDAFTEMGFNEALLSAGATPFKVVERHIDQYIKDNK